MKAEERSFHSFRQKLHIINVDTFINLQEFSMTNTESIKRQEDRQGSVHRCEAKEFKFHPLDKGAIEEF